MTASSFICRFGEGSADWTHLGSGWRQPQNGFRVSGGGHSEFWIENPGWQTDWVLELDLEGGNPPRRMQRLTVVVRGEVVGRCVVAARRRCAFAVPVRLIAAPGPVRVEFRHAPGEKPNDWPQPNPNAPAVIFRRLEIMPKAMSKRAMEPLGGLLVEDLPKATSMPGDVFMRQFESLGENCEFGLVQRRCGAEPLGLFRFGAPKLPKLIECIREGFTHIGKEENLRVIAGPRSSASEYMIQDVRSTITYHTYRSGAEEDEDRLIHLQAQRLRRLAEKLREDIENGQKIMVWRASDVWTAETEVIALHDALCALGPARLLWLECSNADHPPGSLEELRPGLVRGHIHGFCDLGMVHLADAERWLSVCVSAYRHFATAAAPKLSRSMAASRASAYTRPLPSALTVWAHISNVGTVESGEDGWVGLEGGNRAIEGFAIVAEFWPMLSGMTYQILQQDGTMSERAAIGSYCGTNGKGRPIVGFRLHAPDDFLAQCNFVCDAHFTDGSKLEGIASGSVCKAPGHPALVAFRIVVREKCA